MKASSLGFIFVCLQFTFLFGIDGFDLAAKRRDSAKDLLNGNHARVSLYEVLAFLSFFPGLLRTACNNFAIAQQFYLLASGKYRNNRNNGTVRGGGIIAKIIENMAKHFNMT